MASNRSGFSRLRLLRTAVVAMCLLLAATNVASLPTVLDDLAILPASAAGTPCVDSGPSSGAYVARVCITVPADGALITTSTAAVSVSISTVSGTVPVVDFVRFPSRNRRHPRTRRFSPTTRVHGGCRSR